MNTWGKWVAANAIGELVGLCGVFAAGFAFFSLVGEPKSAADILPLAGLTVVLGAFEGGIVGYAQWRVLRTMFPTIGSSSWLTATALGAIIAWLLGMIPSTVASFQSASSPHPPQEPSESTVLILAAGLGAVGGVILSFAQWRVLRRAAEGAGWWLPANAIAWAVAMPWIFFLVGATVAERRTASSIALFLGGLGVAGAVVGAIHGVFLVRVIKPRSEVWTRGRAAS